MRLMDWATQNMVLKIARQTIWAGEQVVRKEPSNPGRLDEQVAKKFFYQKSCFFGRGTR